MFVTKGGIYNGANNTTTVLPTNIVYSKNLL